ncbi:MAG: UDP-2,3-diacylglucosamine diphosphatase [Candidatus Eisenbacteria bacterium]|nr:UDP-2,3-diacylglucosamine diphosphatase [Candidatus Eisenbacteria bacterium]
MQKQSPAVYFLSDAHLGSGRTAEARGASLVARLRELRGHATHLYLLGDLFDFWFEYHHAIPKGHFRILRALAELVDAGVPVDYFGGNHDFWCGSYLQREVGLRVHHSPQRVTHQGRSIFLAHGDGLGPGDRGYRILKAILRHPLAIGLYRLLHPDWGIPFAYRVSHISRQHTAGRETILRRLAAYVAAPRYAAGDDAVVIGHVHDPQHLRDGRGRDFLIVGDWLEHFSWVRLADGAFTLERQWEDRIETVPAGRWPTGSDPTELLAAKNPTDRD